MPSREAPSQLQAIPVDAGAPGPRFPLLYGVLRPLTRPILRGFFGLGVEGADRLPAAGPFILAANHHNYLDGVVLGVVVPQPITFLVMPSVYHATRLHPPFYRHVGAIPINLERPDPGAIKRALDVLERGGVIGIFPEGPFSIEGRLVKGQPGVALIALRAGVPVVPVAIRGTHEALRARPWHVPRRYPLTVAFGWPLFFGRLRRETRIPRALREEVTHEIMAEVTLLLDHAAGAARVGA